MDEGDDPLTGDELLRAMFESSGLGIALVGEDGRPRRANPALQRMLGYSEAELVTMTFAEFTHPDDVAQDRALFLELIAGLRSSYRLEKRYVARGGRVVWGRLTATVHRRPEHGELIGIGMVEDVTAARAAEEDARRSGERLDLALAAAGMGVWERDLATDEVRWSAHLARLVGLDHELVGRYRDFADMVHPDDDREVDTFINTIVHDELPRTIEFRMRRPDGSWRPVAATGRALLGPDGTPRRLVGVVMDITARRALEAGLQQAQKLETLGQIAGGVAHDLNNVLFVVSSSCALLRRSLTDRGQRELLGEIDDAASRAAALVRQLLAFSRREEFHPAAVELDALVGRLRPMLERVVGRSITVRSQLGAGATRVWADATQLEQLVMNLVVNARDAMPGGGTVTIATSAAGEGDALIVVEDTGPGIPPTLRERVFEPFFTTKGPERGTGLGLAVVRAVARQWRGDVTVDGPPEGGAVFRVRFPRFDPVH
ncbi:MAG TPA: PAS domain S-box protein [Kofleriaceae bacterium]|nr:PAS domain S-box protein [Kofleriaceae bacterium]